MNFSKIFILLFVGAAIGCSIWLGFFRDAHDLNKQLTQEDRHAEIVGAKPLPKAPIEIVIKNKRSECRVIDRAELNDSELWVYYHNGCPSTTTGDTIHWTGISPDGTVIVSGWTFTRSDLDAGQRAEFHTTDIKADPRMVKLEVKARWNDEP